MQWLRHASEQPTLYRTIATSRRNESGSLQALIWAARARFCARMPSSLSLPTYVPVCASAAKHLTCIQATLTDSNAGPRWAALSRRCGRVLE